MLSVRDLRVSYDEVCVIHGVSFEVNAGEIVAIVGANGSGKSTVLKNISGLMHPVGGSIEFLGERVERKPAHEMVRRGAVLVPEGRRVFGKLTVRENLLLGGYSVRDKKAVSSRLKEVTDFFPRLGERLEQKAETLSGGEQQMLAIGRALMAGPKLLLMDEVSLGLAPNLAERVFDAIRSIKALGVTVLLVEQKVQEALELADRGYVLQTGRIVMSDSGAKLLETDLVKKAYLGL